MTHFLMYTVVLMQLWLKDAHMKDNRNTENICMDSMEVIPLTWQTQAMMLS